MPTSFPRNRQIPLLSTRLYNQRSSVKSNWLIDDHFRLPELPGTPIPRRRLTSTYYDTSQYDLAHAGITLRHRIERGKQAWQLKLPLMKNRQEIELVDRRPIPPTTFRDAALSSISDSGNSFLWPPCESGGQESACVSTVSLSQT